MLDLTAAGDPISDVELLCCYIDEAKELIAEQYARLQKIDRKGFPTLVAEELLKTMIDTLHLYQKRLASLEDTVNRMHTGGS